jgi:tRNA nucleotidyltransferase (CCA-adding enzyme)
VDEAERDAPHWEHFAHEADIGVRGVAPTKAQAFEQAALALTAVVTDPTLVEAREELSVSCEAPDDELLLVDWLNAVIFAMATRRLLFSRFRVSISGQSLAATLAGEPVDRGRHQPAVEIKGATYTMVRVAAEDGHWIAQTVVDV